MASSTCVARIDEQAGLVPDAVAFENSEGQSITYRELKWRSDALAVALAADKDLPAGAPVVIYGHKSPLMVACFLACAKSGHAYVPVDTVYPVDRVASIVGQIGETVVLDTTPGLLDWSQVPEARNVRSLEQVEAGDEPKAEAKPEVKDGPAPQAPAEKKAE